MPGLVPADEELLFRQKFPKASSPAPSPCGFPHCLGRLSGSPKGHPAPAGGRARSLSHPFGPAFVSVGVRFGVGRQTPPNPRGRAMCRTHKCRERMDAQERPSAALVLGSTVGAKKSEKNVAFACRDVHGCARAASACFRGQKLLYLTL